MWAEVPAPHPALLPQDLQQVMVSGPNLNETSIVSGGYGGTAEGIIPTSTIKGRQRLGPMRAGRDGAGRGVGCLASEGRALVGAQSRARCLPVLPAVGDRRRGRACPGVRRPAGASVPHRRPGDTGRSCSKLQLPWEVAWSCRVQPVPRGQPSCCFVGPLAGVVSPTGTKCLQPLPPGQAVAAACAPAPSLSPLCWAATVVPWAQAAGAQLSRRCGAPAGGSAPQGRFSWQRCSLWHMGLALGSSAGGGEEPGDTARPRSWNCTVLVWACGGCAQGTRGALQVCVGRTGQGD